MSPSSWPARLRQTLDRWVFDYFLDVVAVMLFLILGLVFFLHWGRR